MRYIRSSCEYTTIRNIKRFIDRKKIFFIVIKYDRSLWWKFIISYWQINR